MRFLSIAVVACLLAVTFAAECKPKQELVNGKCVKRCQTGQIRNKDGVCEKDCFKNSHVENGKCVCNDGFEKVASKECAPVCGENMRRVKGEGCICVKGFEMKGKKCVPIGCGENEEARGGKCYCVEGTSRIDGVCTKPCPGEFEKRIDGVCECKKNYERYPEKKGPCVERCGLNSRRLKKTGKCVCLLGFEEKPDGSCKKIKCPKNEVLDGNKCYCKEGTSRINGKCIPPCPENMKRFDGSSECKCTKNYEMIKKKCVKRCGRNSRRLANGKCVCELGFEDVNGKCKPIRCGKGEILDGNDCVPEGGPEPAVQPTNRPAPPPPQPTAPAPPPSCQANARYVGGRCQCNPGFLENAGQCVDNRPCIERDIVPSKEFQLAAGVLAHVRACNKRYMIKSREEGRAFCTKMGAELAAPGHLVQLLASKQQWCACGWLTVGEAKFVNYNMSVHGCGTQNMVNTCRAKFMGKWGGPGWDVYCFRRGAKL